MKKGLISFSFNYTALDTSLINSTLISQTPFKEKGYQTVLDTTLEL